ncbi:MAG: N-acetyl-gamma-glutamyl-phosphate reductase [Treponema sp.]|nr:N-acetyl-gamma-glutamyl-phosphate reductase [Treponema sp.]
MIAGIIGATGYAGAELTRLLSAHPKVEKLILSSVSYEGEKIQDVYPNFLNRIDSPLLKAEDVIASSDVVFSALPHAVGEPYAAACVKRKIHFIDLSADFRFDDDEETYTAWYGKNYQFPELRKNSIYGLPELNRQKIKDRASLGPVIIGNPGCYPTGASLGIMPAVINNLAGRTFNPYRRHTDRLGPVIIDAATGTSGGGRELSRSFHYSECADSVTPYKVASHRHCPEISRNLDAMSSMANAPSCMVIFTPHIVPMSRGILSTIYIPLSENWRVSAVRDEEGANSHKIRMPSKNVVDLNNKIKDLYIDFYKNEPFVRVLPNGVLSSTNKTRHSNFCDISVHVDVYGSTLIVITAIDNMIKGSAGQAVQNMNILFGFKETDGLEAIPMPF